jgi:hypothetical protein
MGRETIRHPSLGKYAEAYSQLHIIYHFCLNMAETQSSPTEQENFRPKYNVPIKS